MRKTIGPKIPLTIISVLPRLAGCGVGQLHPLEAPSLFSGLEVGQWIPFEELPGYLALAGLHTAKGDEHGTEEALHRLDMRWPDIHYCAEAIRTSFPRSNSFLRTPMRGKLPPNSVKLTRPK